MRRWSKLSASRHFFLPHAFPFEFGDFFDEALQFLVIVHRLPDAGFPGLGNADLSRLSVVALDQIEGCVQFALGAVAGGLATLATTNRQSSAKQPVVVGQLGEPGAEIALGRREADAVHGSLLPEIIIIYQKTSGSKTPKRMRICLRLRRVLARRAGKDRLQQSARWMRNHCRHATRHARHAPEMLI